MIRRLPRDVVERIAAGEVVERPASVVKELVENAIDAGARSVDVSIEGGGLRGIVVRDDGRGVEPSDLPLVFEAHATSKLADVDDLLHIGSYGFRGEALASIGRVALVRFTSRAEGADEAFEIVCDAGEVSRPRPASFGRGTRVEVRRLFHNVPARARFLRGESAEGARAVEQAARAAIAVDEVAFTVSVDGREVFAVGGQDDRRRRIGAIHGARLASSLLDARRRFGDTSVEVYLGRPEDARRRAHRQWLFLNGRPIVDRALRAAVLQAYREFLAPGLQPIFYVFVRLPPDEVDVNVHPAKSEVRFRAPDDVFRCVRTAVRDALAGGDLSRRPVLHVRGGPIRTPRFPASSAAPPAERGTSGEVEQTAEEAPLWSESTARRFVPAVPPRTGDRFLVLFATYIAYESGEDLVLVDQHALHERVLFEELRLRASAAERASQRLLVPEVVEVGRAGIVRLEAERPYLERAGFEVEAIGPDAVAVSAVPVALAEAREPHRLVAVWLAGGGEVGPEGEARAEIEERLHTVACHAAVRAGDRLGDEQIAALLERAERLPEAKACPHGRPTVLRFGRSDLERWFGRRGL